MKADRTLIIIPTYNERENATALIERVFALLPDVHILLVDDNSPDGTADAAEQAFYSHPGFSALRRKGPRGLGLSYVDGYRRAVTDGYGRVAQMDADFSHDPKYLPELLRAAEAADVVLGSRYCADGGVEDWPWHRFLLSRFANRYVGFITGLPVMDATSGFRCYTRRALERIPLERIASNGYAFQVEMTYRAQEAGLRIVETPIVFTDRRHGQSKISRRVILESMIMPWRLRFGRRQGAGLYPIGQPLEK